MWAIVHDVDGSGTDPKFSFHKCPLGETEKIALAKIKSLFPDISSSVDVLQKITELYESSETLMNGRQTFETDLKADPLKPIDAAEDFKGDRQFLEKYHALNHEIESRYLSLEAKSPEQQDRAKEEISSLEERLVPQANILNIQSLTSLFASNISTGISKAGKNKIKAEITKAFMVLLNSFSNNSLIFATNIQNDVQLFFGSLAGKSIPLKGRKTSIKLLKEFLTPQLENAQVIATKFCEKLIEDQRPGALERMTKTFKSYIHEESVFNILSREIQKEVEGIQGQFKEMCQTWGQTIAEDIQGYIHSWLKGTEDIGREEAEYKAEVLRIVDKFQSQLMIFIEENNTLQKHKVSSQSINEIRL
ncbi:hypothetical protein TWF718_002092 [Orbilia javanica]|uniref:Uncharacterized protein n=1 Tax=Orbilia javanica TaxID=47235 RepID=A0AAN8N1U9_9PEZI